MPTTAQAGSVAATLADLLAERIDCELSMSGSDGTSTWRTDTSDGDA